MVRSRKVRRRLLMAGATLAAVLALTAVGAHAEPPELTLRLALVTPTVYLAFAGLAVAAPLFVGGAYELFPAHQLTPYPVRPATQFLVSMTVAPLNVAWLAQVFVMVAATAFIAPRDGHLAPALAVTAMYVLFVTAAGQALAWLVVGLRQRRSGRLVTWSLLALLLGLTAWRIHSGEGYRLLDRSPTRSVVVAAVRGSAGQYGRWALTLVVLLVGTGVAALIGSLLCGWALRRPGDAPTEHEGVALRRRGWKPSVLAELVAKDRASVWRSAPLRRGLLFLSVVPGIVAAGAAVGWHSLTLLPALVAPGAGLLFGVNVFALDGSGAAWLASQPCPPRQLVLSKLRVVGETCLIAVLLATAVGALRAPTRPTGSEAVGLVTSALVSVAVVTAICMDISLRKPYHAELRGRRDTPAPPGAMALYSARLAVTTTVVALVIAAAAAYGPWWLPAGLGLAVGLLAGLSLLQSVRRWDNPEHRALVTVTVAYG